MEALDFFIGAGHCHFSSENRHIFDNKPADNDNNNNGGNQFTIDDLLDFSKEDDEVMTDAFFNNLTAPGTSTATATATNSADSSTITVLDSCDSRGEPHFSDASHFSNNNDDELCIPYDDLAELEWLSNFVEESFSSDELHNLQLISASKAPTDTTTSSHTSPTVVSYGNTTSPPPPQVFLPDVSVPGKARSKRSRAAPCDWSSRLLVLSPANSSSEDKDDRVQTAAAAQSKKRVGVDVPGRKCLHCASEKTPQWRTGPMGPKTLCNACGVRYKSGRLVPEYRPAASPTFVSTKHSNSHRKVLELRRQRELHGQQQQQLLGQSSIFGDDYLLHHPNGTAFRHLV